MKRLTRYANQALSTGFFADHDLDFATRGLLGRAVRGGAEVGEVLATVARVRGPQDWAREWSATAERVEARGSECRTRGRVRSASAHYLRAATYWAAAVDGHSIGVEHEALLAAFRNHRRCWDAFVDCSAGCHLPIAVPYQGDTLPGYLLRPDAGGAARPTLVVTNGSDGSLADLWSSAIAGALLRGWNAFVYDGPGQQSMLFERHTAFRPDWEAVLTPVIDVLAARPDVDATRLTGYGISQGGYWLTRALGFEHRLRAAVVDPGVVDVSTSWTGPLGASLRRLLRDGDRERFNRYLALAARLPGLRRTLTFRSRPYVGRLPDAVDWFGVYRTVSRYALAPDVLAAIRTPLLITDPDREQFWPGQSARLAGLLGDRAEVIRFETADGAGLHCQPTGRLLTELAVFDWLEERLGEPNDRVGGATV